MLYNYKNIHPWLYLELAIYPMAIFDKTPIYQPLTSNKQLEDKYFHGITVHKNEKAIPVQYKLKPGIIYRLFP